MTDDLNDPSEKSFQGTSKHDSNIGKCVWTTSDITLKGAKKQLLHLQKRALLL